MLQRRLEIGFALFLLAALTVFLVIGLSYPPRPRELPLLVSGAGIVLVLIHLVNIVRSRDVSGGFTGARSLPTAHTTRGVDPGSHATAHEPRGGSPRWNWRPVFMSFGSMVLYLGATLLIGMVLSSAIIVYGSSIAFGARDKLKVAVLAVTTVMVIEVLFGQILGVPLYRGMLGDLLWE
jgi:hypothetical protein